MRGSYRLRFAVANSLFLLGALIGMSRQSFAAPAQDLLVLDPARSRIAFTLEGNLHTVHGTFALKRGTVRIDPKTGLAGGEVVIDAVSGDSNDKLRDDKMKDDILKVGQYPEISLLPAAIEAHRDSNGNFQGTMKGVVVLHGESHQQVLAITGRIEGDELTATTNLTIPYVEWGMKNPSFLLFRVRDTVDVEITAIGHLAWADRAARDQTAVGMMP